MHAAITAAATTALAALAAAAAAASAAAAAAAAFLGGNEGLCARRQSALSLLSACGKRDPPRQPSTVMRRTA